VIARRIFLIGLVVLAATVPAEAGISVGTLTLESEAQRGQAYRGTFTVANTDSVPRTAVVYQTDYTFHSDGSNRFDEPGQAARSNASWITFSPHRIEVPPGQSATVSYEVRVPEDAALVGTYWSMLMVEEVADPGLPTRLQRNQTEVRQTVRYGVQCITHIAGTGRAQLAFTGTRLVSEEGESRELQVDVENTGERWLSPAAWMELYDGNGRQVGRFESEKKRIFPGTSVRFRISLGDTPSGKYKALVVLDNGDQNVFGAKYDLEY
jgi:P pilus assembly chaperone PapD